MTAPDRRSRSLDGRAGDTKPDAKKPEAKKPDAKPELDTKKMAMTPADELGAHVKFLAGVWHCAGQTTPAGNIGKPFASKGNTTWALSLDNFWLSGSSEGEKVPGQPLATVFKGESKVTYDRIAKQFVFFGAGNRGGYRIVSERMENGKWSVVGDEVCKKK